MATSESNDAFAMAADQERDVFLRRTDPHFLNRDRVVFTRVRTRAVVAQAAYDLQRLSKPANPLTRRQQPHTDCVMFDLCIPGTKPQHESARCHLVDRDRCSSKQCWMVKLIVEDQGAHPKCGGRLGGDQ